MRMFTNRRRTFINVQVLNANTFLLVIQECNGPYVKFPLSVIQENAKQEGGPNSFSG